MLSQHSHPFERKASHMMGFSLGAQSLVGGGHLPEATMVIETIVEVTHAHVTLLNHCFTVHTLPFNKFFSWVICLFAWE